VTILLRSDGGSAKNPPAAGRDSGPTAPFTNTLGMRFAPIAPGRFLMGSPASETGHQPDELQHEVVLTRGFYMGAHPVTVGQFRQFVQSSPYQSEATRDKRKLTWQSPGFVQTDDNPVLLISWNDAVAFCGWLSKREGRTYRLPSEAEWEYCCRAGTTTAFSFGDARQAKEYAWTAAHSGGKPHPVGQLRPNAWGLYDMHGCVWQWTNDWYAADYFQRSPKEDPVGPGAGTGSMGPTKVLRGGSYSVDLPFCRSAIRKPRPPNYYTPHSGFRIVCER
jgi:formylglycine-generating enzyme required for sulfatase activity